MAWMSYALADMSRSCCGFLLCVLAACGTAPATTDTSAADPAPAATSSPVDRAAAFVAAARRAEQAQPAGAVTLRALEEPLPDGVLPTFEYSRIGDITTRTANTTRMVTMQVRGIDPNDAYRSLRQAFEEKGYRTSDMSDVKGGGVAGSFSKGGQGGGLPMVVAAGGTHVMVVTSVYDEAQAARSNGFSGVVTITINTP
jgi:hypothetical protein